MVGALRLPLRFDADLLLRDVRVVEERARWIDHWAGTPGDWTVIPLVTSTGEHRRFGDTHFTAGLGKPTRLLAEAPHIQAAVADFRAPILHARLNRLAPHGSIHPHRDFGYYGGRRFSFERGCIRVHIPILTNEKVQFVLDGARLDMRPGEAWYVNVCETHAVENASDCERIHLVLDVELNDWLRQMFPPESMSDKVRGALLRRYEPTMWWILRKLKPGGGALQRPPSLRARAKR